MPELAVWRTGTAVPNQRLPAGRYVSWVAFAPMLLATKDKSWLIAPELKRRVWRPAAWVEAVLLIHGRMAGTWRYDRRSKGLRIRMSPFASLTRRAAQAVEQAKAVAKFFGLELTTLDWLDS